MLRRVNPIVLISLIAALVLSLAIFAAAKPGGGSPDAALGAAMGQVGAPYGFGTDGGGSFSCTGLVRHALRSAGVDPNAPWDHMAYLSVYPTVSSPQPGDVVVYPDGAAMYAGNGQVVMANEVDGVVGTYGMNEIGIPVGFASPYDGAVDPAMSDPAAVQPAGGQAVDPALAVDPAMGAVDPMWDASMAVDPAMGAVDPMWDASMAVDPAIGAVDPAVPAGQTAVDPAMGAVDPLMP